MKKTFRFAAVAALALSLHACKKNDTSLPPETVNKPLQLKVESGEFKKECGYVDQYWGSNAYLDNFIINWSQSYYIYDQHNRIASFFGQDVNGCPLGIVHDNTASTYNAYSYSNPRKIYYGEDIYEAALNYGQIVTTMILAHEWGHQLQYTYNIPSVQENTARASELEADGFAGYYMGSPYGYAASWVEAYSGFEFAFSIGDYATNDPGHHGTPPQRRSATRLGWYLGGYQLSPEDFDFYFFYYYNNVLAGLYRTVPAGRTIDPAIDSFMQTKIDELRKINNGEITGEQLKNLPNR
jgi:uncharacterized protein